MPPLGGGNVEEDHRRSAERAHEVDGLRRRTPYDAQDGQHRDGVVHELGGALHELVRAAKSKRAKRATCTAATPTPAPTIWRTATNHERERASLAGHGNPVESARAVKVNVRMAATVAAAFAMSAT